MKGWVALVGWPTADVWPTKWSSGQLAVRRRTGKVRRSKTSVLPLCYATNCLLVQLGKRSLRHELPEWWAIQQEQYQFESATIMSSSYEHCLRIENPVCNEYRGLKIIIIINRQFLTWNTSINYKGGSECHFPAIYSDALSRQLQLNRWVLSLDLNTNRTKCQCQCQL